MTITSIINRLGQTINVGDKVAYFLYQGMTPRKGTVLGFTDSGQVRIELDGQTTRKIRNTWTKKVVSESNGAAWVRRPRTHYIEKATGHLVDEAVVMQLSWPERWEKFTVDPEGKLAWGYEFFEVPAVFVGPMPQKRLVKIG